MATNPRKELQEELNKSTELLNGLRTIENQIEDLETRYLERTANEGNILIGWNQKPHYHHHRLCCHPRIKLMPKDLAFSLSSITSNAYKGLFEDIDNKQITGPLEMRFISPNPPVRNSHRPAIVRNIAEVSKDKPVNSMIRTRRKSKELLRNSSSEEQHNQNENIRNDREASRERAAKNNPRGRGKKGSPTGFHSLLAPKRTWKISKNNQDGRPTGLKRGRPRKNPQPQNGRPKTNNHRLMARKITRRLRGRGTSRV